MRWGAAAGALLMLAVGCTGGDDDRAFCDSVERLGGQRAADVTDVETIHAVVSELPSQFADDAAMFYYPYGGTPPPDADGGRADEAGKRLYAHYDQTCGYRGP